jgi:hypothetical protein
MATDERGEFGAAHARHVQVHQDQIRLERFHRRHDLFRRCARPARESPRHAARLRRTAAWVGSSSTTSTRKASSSTVDGVAAAVVMEAGAASEWES